jgi:hypothetical protein
MTTINTQRAIQYNSTFDVLPLKWRRGGWRKESRACGVACVGVEGTGLGGRVEFDLLRIHCTLTQAGELGKAKTLKSHSKCYMLAKIDSNSCNELPLVQRRRYASPLPLGGPE